MKHKPVLIKGTDLYNRLFSDSDWHEPELADALGLETKRDEEGFELVDWTDQALNAWWKVTWPEHITSSSYNGDATYSQIRPEDCEAYVQDGALVYGDLSF